MEALSLSQMLHKSCNIQLQPSLKSKTNSDPSQEILGLRIQATKRWIISFTTRIMRRPPKLVNGFLNVWYQGKIHLLWAHTISTQRGKWINTSTRYRTRRKVSPHHSQWANQANNNRNQIWLQLTSAKSNWITCSWTRERPPNKPNHHCLPIKNKKTKRKKDTLLTKHRSIRWRVRLRTKNFAHQAQPLTILTTTSLASVLVRAHTQLFVWVYTKYWTRKSLLKSMIKLSCWSQIGGNQSNGRWKSWRNWTIPT